MGLQNPTEYGAPSPVGRGGATGDIPLGAIGYFSADPGPKYALARGGFVPLSDAQISAIGLDPQIQTNGAPELRGLGITAYAVAYGNGTYVVCNGDSANVQSTTVMVSTDDGANFTQFSANNPNAYQAGLKFVAGYFYMQSGGKLLRSQTGKIWENLVLPSDMGSISGIAAGNGCLVILSSAYAKVYTHDAVNGFVQKQLPQITSGTTVSGALWSQELGYYIVYYYNPSTGYNYLASSADLVSYSTIIQYSAAPSIVCFGAMAINNGTMIEWRDYKTGAYITQTNAQVSSIYDMVFVNGLLVVAGTGGISELTDIGSVNKLTTSQSMYIAGSGKGFLATQGGGNSNYNLSRQKNPNGLWMPSPSRRKLAKGVFADPYMRIA